jgi:hypothetical protein
MRIAFQWAVLGIAAGTLIVPVAHANPNGGVVTGKIELPQLGLGDQPERNRGFLERSRHPLRAPEPFDPRQEMIVVLTGGPIDREDTKPLKRPVPYRLVGEAFEVPVLPIVKGSEVELKNQTKKAPQLYSPTDAKLIKSDQAIFNPDATRLLKDMDAEYTVYHLRARDSAHLQGAIVTFPHSYFTVVDKSGQFAVPGVPGGEWQVRVWYQNGWLKLPSVRVISKPKASATVTVHLPQKLVVSPPGSE